MADRSSPTLPRRDRSRSRYAAVAEARERERGRSESNPGSTGALPTTPNSQGFSQYLPSMPGARATSTNAADPNPGGGNEPVVPRKADARKAHKREKSWSPLFKSSSEKQNSPSTDRQPSDPSGLTGDARRPAMLPGGVADSVKNSLRKFSVGDGSTSRSRGGSVGTGGSVAIELDQHRFMDDTFDPDEYILTALHSNSEEGVRNFYRRLGDAKEAAATDLKANVYKNYSEFVLISKEIAQLETDMLVLRGLLTDMRAVHDHFRSYVGVDVLKSTGSIDNLAQASNISLTQPLEDSANNGGIGVGTAESQAAQALQTMYDMVDGAAKLVPPSSARNIVHSGPLLELDSAMRVKGDIIVYLMADTLLVAAKKRRMPLGSSAGAKLLSSSTSSGTGKYTALQALSVQEITVLDVRDSPDVSWAFKIVRGPISFVFRCPNGPAEKKAWMTAIKRATEDWSSGGGGGLVGSPEGGGANGTGAGSDLPSRGQPKLSKEAEAKLQELLDELDVYIATREFDRALDLIRQLKGMPSSSHLPNRIQALSSVLLRDLASITSSNGSKRAVLTAMQRLIQLGHTAQARDTFLAARTTNLRDTCRKIRFQGDLAAYVRDFGSVLMAGVHTTVAWYREAITDPAMVSFLVQWAREQVGELARATVRQVGDESLRVVVACLDVSVERIRTLRSSGLDLEFAFWEAVQEHAARAIEAFERLCAEAVARSIIDDSFDPIKNDYNDGITRSTMQFCKTILDFLTNTKFFHPFQMFHAQLFGCLSGLFEAFVNWQIQVHREKPLNATQQSAVGANVQFTLSLFFPKVIHQVERQFRAKAHMLVDLRSRLEGVARDASLLGGGGPAKVSRSPSTRSVGTPPKEAPAARRPSQPASPIPTGSVASLAIPGSPARTSHGSLGPGSPDGSHGMGSRRSSSGSANILAEPVQRPRRPTRDRSNELGAGRSSGDVSGSAPGLVRRPSAASSPISSPSNSRHASAADLAGSIPSPLFATLFDLQSRLSPTGPAAVAVASGAEITSLLPSVAMRRFVRTRPSSHIVDQVLKSATEVPVGQVPVAAVTQLVLDIHYMLNSVEVSEQGAGTAQGLCEQGLRAYLMNGGDPGQLMSGEWYEQRVAEALARDTRGEM